MKSGKQKRIEIKNARKNRHKKKYELLRDQKRKEVLAKSAPCNPELLTSKHSISDPPFVTRGYYLDILFKCKDCGEEDIWSATRQKWWYEVAKGDVWTTAIRCNACRRKERERKTEARRVHMEGLTTRKQSKRT
jgi:hypothetical protein